jgi:Acetyltransferase (GNAT) domain
MSSDPSPRQSEPQTDLDPSSELRVTFRTEPGGEARVDLMAGERSVSRLWVIPLTIRVGAATVRMDGIGGVGTEEDCRHRGYSRRVLEATVDWMRQRDAAISMLYGIPNFYPKFGYATAGPEHFIELTRLSEPAILPAGWRARPFAAADLPAVRRLYDQNSASGVGPAVRSPEAPCWSRLTAPRAEHDDDCRIVVDPDGQVRAYVWRARWHWEVGIFERQHRDALVLGEVMADGPAAADAALAACRQWAAEEPAARPEPVTKVLLALPPEGPIAASATRQAARFVQSHTACGGSMARVLDVGRLLEALKPELARRLQASRSAFAGAIHFCTDLGDAVLQVTTEGLTVAGPNDPASRTREGAAPARARIPSGGAGTVELCLPQTVLARLALGAFPPDDLLDRLEQPVTGQARELVCTLFPPRHPHMYLPDRY